MWVHFEDSSYSVFGTEVYDLEKNNNKKDKHNIVTHIPVGMDIQCLVQNYRVKK